MPEKITGKVVVTGAAGFIGSQIASRIRPETLILVDKLTLFKERGYNPSLLSTADIIEAEDVFFEALPSLGELSWIIHMGALRQVKKGAKPPVWYGLKFFNVFGPNEGHKERMASSIWHGLNEIQKTGSMTLFKSHNPKFKDGEQARDFIFVDDILQIVDFVMAKKPESAIYNCGTGTAGTFL